MPRPLTHTIGPFTVRSRAAGEEGFALIESLAALGVIFVVLLGLLASMGAGTRGLVGGRQRTGAVQVARRVVEDARAALYATVGHDLGGDTTLAGDSRLTSTSPRQFEGENLVGSPNPLYPQHQWDLDVDASTFHVSTYVTWVTDPNADPYKRITVIVTWDRAKLSAEGANEVRVSSLLFPAGAPSDPAVDGTVEAEAGTVTVTGELAGADLSRAIVYHPSAAGSLHSLFVRDASGSARSSRALLELTAGTPTGCSVTGAAAECAGIRADTTTDSDTATSFPEHESDDPTAEGSGSLSAAGRLDLSLDSGSSVGSRSTSRSCLACMSPPLGDDDGLAHHWSEGVGAGSTEVDWDAGSVAGSLVDVAGPATAEVTLDQDNVTGSHLLQAAATVDVPAVDVLSVAGGPAGFDYAARIEPVNVSTSAESGPTAGTPAVTGNGISIQLYDTVGANLGYRTVTVQPGVEAEHNATASFTVGSATVTLTTTVLSGGRSTSSTTDAGAVTAAEASLANWLRVTVHLDVVDSGTTLADLDVEYDYGRLLTRVEWEGPS
jgi:type II secretory pathway pseudopilin PulG